MPLVVRSSFDTTKRYTHETAKMIVPCPKAIPGKQKPMTTFSLSVWLTMGLVLLLTTPVFWCAGNVQYRSMCNVTHISVTVPLFPQCLAVFIGVAFPQQPTTSTLIVFFFLYVCFCFVISTVFREFFVFYLVDPKFEKKLETLDELLESDVVYGNYQLLGFGQVILSYLELVKFLEHGRLQRSPEMC